MVALSTVRTLALYTQGLTQRQSPTPENITRLVEQLGSVQIDTLQMVHRSQYVALWSRFGTYDPKMFDQLIFEPGQRQFYEYWWHAACIIPLKHYRYSLPKMRYYRENGHEWNPGWAGQNQAIIHEILEHVRQHGAVRTSDFERDQPRQGSWWDWKPSKRALEHLYNRGDLMIASRINFNRVYDLKERVLPEWVDTTEPTEDEVKRHIFELSLKAVGVGDLPYIAGYHFMKLGDARKQLAALQKEGKIKEMQATLLDGKTHTLYVHVDNLPLLEQIEDGAIRAEHTTFLTPFDSLFWGKNARDERCWNFKQRLEAYTPEPKREYGYFCLPILYKDQLIGRFDPKLERKTGTLRLKALHLAPGLAVDEAMISAVAGAMRDFLKFHKATNLIIEKSNPPAFGEKLMAAL